MLKKEKKIKTFLNMTIHEIGKKGKKNGKLALF